MIKKANQLLIAIVLFTAYSLHAQVAVNNDGSSAHTSAMLDVKSSNKGVLLPRISQDDIKSINNPANGLMVFNTDDDRLYIFVSSELKWKEVSFGSGEILYPATISIGSGGSCSNTSVNGTYSAGCALSSSNTVTLDATVTSPGAWNITTDTINGYSFSGNGIIMTTGTVQVTLNGSGTPVSNQTDALTATVNATVSSTCTFNVLVAVIDCDDGNACTDDFFNANTCSCDHYQVDCDDGNACTDDICDPISGCQHIPIDCDDGNPNTLDGCDTITGCYNILTTINGKTKQDEKSDSKEQLK
jgi:hypothetical protein